MIEIIKRLDEGTVLARGPKFRAGKVISAMLLVVRDFARAADNEATWSFAALGDWKPLVTSADYAILENWLHRMTQSFDASTHAIEVRLGSYDCLLYPTGGEGLFVQGGKYRSNPAGNEPKLMELSPYLIVSRVGSELRDKILTLEDRITVTELFAPYVLNSGAALIKEKDGLVGVLGVLTLPHLAYGDGYGEIRIACVTR